MIQIEFDKFLNDNEFQANHELKLIINQLPSGLIGRGSNDSTRKRRPKSFKNLPQQKSICLEKREIINMNDFLRNSRFIHAVFF